MVLLPTCLPVLVFGFGLSGGGGGGGGGCVGGGGGGGGGSMAAAAAAAAAVFVAWCGRRCCFCGPFCDGY